MNSLHKTYQDLTLVIATKHEKEIVLKPLLEKTLGVHCVVPSGIDTDKLGMFSGEIERTLDPLSAAREKCLLALSMTDAQLAVASEGSFYPHPQVGFVSVNEELLLFMDVKRNIEVHVKHLSTETNFDKVEVSSFSEIEEFAHKVGYPSHGIILKLVDDKSSKVYKDIENLDDLKNIFELKRKKITKIEVETDMRAHRNPTRMKVIAEAGEKLNGALKSNCPKCNTIGFAAVDSRPGLKCKNCGLPTRSTFFHVYECKACHFSENRYFPNGKESEDPMYCDFCNP